jgi:hypothetical protein
VGAWPFFHRLCLHNRDPTLGDAILDRLAHSAHKIILKGHSSEGNKMKKPRKAEAAHGRYAPRGIMPSVVPLPHVRWPHPILTQPQDPSCGLPSRARIPWPRATVSDGLPVPKYAGRRRCEYL